MNSFAPMETLAAEEYESLPVKNENIVHLPFLSR
jgi:hypothetical protein